MENNVKYRGLSEKFITAWDESELKDFYEEHKNELFIGIRDEYINIYYKCASISKISLTSNGFKYEIANRYLNCDAEKGRQTITFDCLKSEYNQIKKNVDHIQSAEKISQQIFAQNINKNKNSKWQCIDIEYVKDGQAGRFDIIAVTKQKPYKTALIELKYDSGAIGGNNGICKHAEDFLLFADENRFETYLKKELCSIINSYRKLVSSSKPLVSVEDFNKNADIYFVILANQNNKLLAQTKRYLFDNLKDDSTKNFQKLIKDKQYEKKLEKFDPIFLFSDVCLLDKKELNIDDLIGFDKYKLIKSSNQLEDLAKF